MHQVFIDTNIFLGLYETNNNNIDNIFADISKLKSTLVFSEQVYDEFLRNRDSILQKEIKSCEKNKVELHTTALINHLDHFNELNKLKKQYKDENKKLIESLKTIQSNTDDDPILKGFLSIYNDDQVKRFERTKEIIRKARTRLLIGNPPIDKKKGTIGDQIIWETLLEKVTDDLIFVTEDKTYSEHKSFIEREFLRGKDTKVHITDKVSFALCKIGEVPSQELKDFENSRAYNNFLNENEVKDLRSHFAIEGLEISNSELYELFKKSEDEYDEFMKLIGIDAGIEDRYRKSSHSIHSDYITLYRKYFNPNYSPYIEE